ncbi:uncharacterized protein [Physcomitrium patens]|uniref:WRC domain-containing protein n=1 Tax=Physcomitrium patens TaxID=3218 RepID=A0A2K1K2W7_PHYPA|nr:uncharacterized protein LOC112286913 [Physcomitrium patens]XP_024385076.1 uncharacterized protein LOC112286913 [Physcomitrium patens]XP_024385077.1 uncharacterized protein LOC112286913 [Physcomitrium patens]PNR48125.1 hypothetical protein PHYPA_012598 [Physcomitrium patens]|eukprot:XP_024385075.1 uncharacterized protein LOC112286913 [Physcomitrella patens]
MKIRKQVQKVLDLESAGGSPLLETSEGDRFSRQISLETENGGRLLLGKSLFGDSSPPTKQIDARTTSTSQDGALGCHQGPANNLVGEADMGAQGSPSEGDQTHESLEQSNSGSCGDWTLEQDHNLNTRRKYARRSSRSAGGGTLVVQSGNGYSNGNVVFASHAAKVTQRRCNPSRGEPRCRSEHPSHPLQEPEGSLLHCLYLQLLAADKEGMTLKEIFASFATQTRFSSLGRNWRERVKDYLKSSPYFRLGAKARYFLCETPQKVPKASKSGADGHVADLFDLNEEPKASRRLASADSKSRQVDCDTVLSSLDPSVVNNELEGVQTRRKAYERTIEAVLNESVVEFQKTQKVEEICEDRSTDELSTASKSDVRMATPAEAEPASASIRESKKRKSLIHGDGLEPSNVRFIAGAVPGSLKAMQARIVAEQGVQNGVRCSRKDGSNNHSKWQCPMMAMEGKSLCKHHNFLSERKKARYKNAKRQAAGKHPLQENKLERGTRKNPVMDQLHDLNKPAGNSIDKGEHGTQIDEASAPAPVNKSNVGSTDRIIRTRSDAHNNGSLADSNNVQSTEDIHSEAEGGQALLKSMAELGRQSRSTRKPRMYLAAKKTAEKTTMVAPAPGKSVKKQSVPLIRPPSIPPLPMLYGVRRKSMKNRSQIAL